ncbi:MAG: ribonuclease III [Alphaproteobacteria bacterium]|nr:ribonuclease III [Alphaproteobacteria bacterium]MDX5368763.1 ribonuclease III [Alphaproteobacteria bacterium]MDX5463499.1 ribonuclease III [Alphaproteobacteria bacterium]
MRRRKTVTLSPEVTEPLESAIGYRFSDRALLTRALTHSSREGEQSNERLEFLGDRVLNLVIAEALFRRFEREEEGGLASRLNALVRKETCAEVAKAVGIGPVLRLSPGEKETGGREKPAILGDACEALIAAVLLDADFDIARAMVLRLWADYLDGVAQPPRDPKNALQEWTQGRGLGVPDYEVVGREGPDHAPVFTVAVRVRGYPEARASGSSRRAGEQAAAQRMLEAIEANGNA